MASNQIKNTRYKATTGQTRWATEEEIKRSATKVDLHAASYPTAGIPGKSNKRQAMSTGRCCPTSTNLRN